jgi:hypothetical protein
MTATMDMRRLADCDNDGSLSNRMRSRRFELFDRLAGTLERPLSILDIGGTNEFWAQRGWAGRDDVTITTVNLAEEPQLHPKHPPAGRRCYEPVGLRRQELRRRLLELGDRAPLHRPGAGGDGA